MNTFKPPKPPPQLHRPARGDLYEHTETGTVAEFTGWRRNIANDELLMVLWHGTFGECRWSPIRARLYRAVQATGREDDDATERGAA